MFKRLKRNARRLMVKASLGMSMVKVVFSIYLAVALLLTLGHFAWDYYDRKAGLVAGLEATRHTRGPALARSLWNIDLQAVRDTMQGMIRRSDIRGIIVVDSRGLPVMATGEVLPAEEKILTGKAADLGNQLEILPGTRAPGIVYEPGLFKVSYPLELQIDSGQKARPGSIYLYTSPSVIFEEASGSFIYMLLSALINYLVLAGMFIYLVWRNVDKPLITLTSLVRKMDFENLQHVLMDERLMVKKQLANRRDSVGQLFRSWNLMVRKGVERDRALVEALSRADAASHAKTTFVSNMSHELRTPLHCILGFSELLIEDARAKEETKTMVDDLARIKEAGSHLLGIVTDILDLNAIESGRIQLTYDDFAVKATVKKVVDLVRPIYKKNENSLSIKIAGDEESIHTDEVRLQQILFHLLSNAAKYTKKGRVRLLIQVRMRNDTRWLSVRVVDTGIGMNQGQKDNIFEKFVQVHEVSSQTLSGTGLGLYLTRKLCHLMGGDIRVISAEGDGSEFRVDLPVSGGEMRERPTELENRGTLEGPAGLYVGKEGEESQAINKILHRLDFVDDPVMATRLLDARPAHYDVVIVDYETVGPQISRLIRWIRERYPRCLVIACVDAPLLEQRFRLSEGLDGVVSRPFSTRDINKMLGRLLAEEGEKAHKKKSAS